MALVTLEYRSRRSRLGDGKRGEMSGNYEAMIQGMARTAEAWGDFEEAKRLRALLRPQPMSKVLDNEPVYASDQLKAKRGKRKKNPPSLSTNT